VGFPAVELDHLPGSAPMAIDLESLLTHHDPVVKTRLWQAMLAQEGQEPFLQRAPAVAERRGFDTSKGLPQSPHPASARIAVDKVKERKLVIEAQVFDWADCALDAIDRGDGRYVQNRTGWGGHRNAVNRSSLVCGQNDDMSVNLSRCAATVGNSDVDPAPRVGSNPPERRRREVTEHCCGARGQSRSKPPPLTTDYRMPHGIDARMQPVQTSSPNPPIDRFLTKSKPPQLPPPHHTMLPRRQRGNPPIIPASPRKPLLGKGWRGLGGHAPTVAGPASRVVRGG
jgi:hypothetical protein